MASKEKVLAEIRRIAREEGRPPGQKLFKRKTGFSHSYWNGTYWPRWSAALKDAGLEQNERNSAIPRETLLSKYLELVSELNAVPALSDLRFKNRQDKEFPATSTFQKRVGGQTVIVQKAYDFALENDYSTEVLELLESKINSQAPSLGQNGEELKEGWVYLLNSGEFYKIGRGTDLERRVKQVSTAMPETLDLVHSIKTDDPSGIESYWHRRFKDKRANGEWFKLDKEDIKAFKFLTSLMGIVPPISNSMPY